MTERPEDAMTETTTLRELALVKSINEPDATMAEHMDVLAEAAAALGLSDAPDAPLSDADADAVLRDAALMVGAEDDHADAAYEAWRDSATRA